MKLYNIIWDFDGTLYDTDTGIVSAFAEVLQSNYGVMETASRIEALVKIDTKHCARVISDEYSLDYATLLAQARSTYDEIGLELQGPFQGAQSCCERVVALGGKNVIVTHRDKASCMRFLSRYGFDAYFAQVVTKDDGFPLKPSPESFRHVIDTNGMERNATCGVGDRDIDVDAANASGVLSFYFCPKGTINENASRCISRLAELEEALGC